MRGVVLMFVPNFLVHTYFICNFYVYILFHYGSLYVLIHSTCGWSMCMTYIVTMEFCMKRGELSIYLCGMNLIVQLLSTLVYEWVYATRQKEYIDV